MGLCASCGALHSLRDFVQLALLAGLCTACTSSGSLHSLCAPARPNTYVKLLIWYLRTQIRPRERKYLRERGFLEFLQKFFIFRVFAETRLQGPQAQKTQGSKSEAVLRACLPASRANQVLIRRTSHALIHIDRTLKATSRSPLHFETQEKP